MSTARVVHLTWTETPEHTYKRQAFAKYADRLFRLVYDMSCCVLAIATADSAFNTCMEHCEGDKLMCVKDVAVVHHVSSIPNDDVVCRLLGEALDIFKRTGAIL